MLKQDLRGLPNAIQKRVARVLTQMASDPFQGNAKALQGADWKGVFRASRCDPAKRTANNS